MIAEYGGLSQFVGSNSRVAVQGQGITITGGVHMGGPDDSPEAKYAAGVANLEGRNPGQARELIWQAMMGWEAEPGGCVRSEVLFRWLVAMLSGRTARQFSKEEIGQLQRFRDRFTGTEEDGWTAGVRLVYELLDSVLRHPDGGGQPKARRPLSPERFEELGEEQRRLLLPLDLFLSGPRRDEIWQEELRAAQVRQCSGDRENRAWKFFHPDPARVVLPQARRPVVTPADRRWVGITVTVFTVFAVCYGMGMLWFGAVPGLIGYGIALLGVAIAVAGNLEARFLADRRRLEEEQFGTSARPVSQLRDDELAEEVNKLFKKYIEQCEEDRTERERWKRAVESARKVRRDEVLAICRSSGASADEVAWFIRYEIGQLHQAWRDGALRRRRLRRLLRPDAAETCRVGQAVVILGGLLVGWELRLYAVGLLIVVMSAVWARHFWLPVRLEHKRFRADDRERHRRQESIDKAHREWADKLRGRPEDIEMAEWLERDRTVLLGKALDYFQLTRSRVIAHGFLERSSVGAKRRQLEGCLPRYEGYQIWMFLLAEDGVRQMRASLDFLSGTLTEREQLSFGYDAITAVHVMHKPWGGQTFELRLTGGDPITVQVRKPDPKLKSQGKDAAQSQDDAQDDAEDRAENAERAEENQGVADSRVTDLDVASVTNTLHILEGVAAEGRKWLDEHAWATVWAGEETETSAIS